MSNQHITLKQITCAAASMIIGTSIQTKQLYSYMKHEAWIAVVLGFVICLFVYLIYSSLANRFPSLSLIEINDSVFGRVIGKIVSGLYIYYFFTIACLNVNLVGNFVKGIVLPNTPTVFILFLFVFVCIWAARKGPVNLMKYSVLLMVISIVSLLMYTMLLIPEMDFKRLMPVLSLPPINYAVGTHSIAMVPLSDPFYLMMYLPYIGKANGFGKALAKGLIIGVSYLMVLVLRDPSILGLEILSYSLPSLMSIRMIDIGDILTRIDIIYIGVVLMLMFYKVALLFYASASGMQRLLKTDSEKIFINILGALLILYAMTVFRSASEHSQWLVSGAAHIHHMLYVIVLPLLTLIVAAVRGMTKTAAAAGQADVKISGKGAEQA